MTGLKVSMKMLRAACSAGALLAGSSALTPASAADLPSTKAPLPVLVPMVDDYEPFFVKLGVTYVINTSSSTTYGPLGARVVQGDVGTYPQHVGATLSNIVTLGGEAGYFVTRNISVNVSGGIPFFVKVNTKGFNPLNPTLVDGTLLGQGELGLIPVTLVYHFNQFGAIQPYLGAGFAPSFSFANKNAFLTDIKIGGSVGLVLQAGADYMIDRNWGVGFDVKKFFTYAETQASGVALLPGVPTESVLHTRFQPWLLSLGLTYRFGASALAAPVVAKY